MAIPVARVHLAMAHAALPALLPTPPQWEMLRLLPTPCVAAAAIPPKPLAKLSHADSDERWDAHKTMLASSLRSTSTDSIRSSAGRGSFRKNATWPPHKPGRADAVERWDAHKKAAPSSSSSGAFSLASSSKWQITRATTAERWDVHKERRPLQADQRLNDGESRSTSSSDDIDTEEEILWKPRAMYAGPGFVGAAPEPSILPMPTALFCILHALHSIDLLLRTQAAGFFRYRRKKV